MPTLELVRLIRGAVSLPWWRRVASWTARTSAKRCAPGAAAAQLGTAFLACPESGASAAYRGALVPATADTTVLTRAFSGRWARGLRNEVTIAGEQHPAAILPIPRRTSSRAR